MHWIIERAPRDEDTDPMLWIATRRRTGQDDMARLMAVLQERGIPHTCVRKPPLADYLVSMTSDTPITIEIDEPVFVYGSTTMELVAKNAGWAPGFFDAPEMLEAIDHWGAHMLNHDARVAEIGSMTPPQGTFFIRPDSDGKAFAGTVMNDEDFTRWRDQLLNVKGWTSLPPKTRVLYAPVRRLHAEWRLAIVNGKVATGSQYCRNGKLDIAAGAPAEVIAFAEARANEWHPRQAFMMDVCQIDEGLRIVETNSISSAGFYAMDMQDYVTAIEGLTHS